MVQNTVPPRRCRTAAPHCTTLHRAALEESAYAILSGVAIIGSMAIISTLADAARRFL
jgi:hypothetical protein